MGRSLMLLLVLLMGSVLLVYAEEDPPADGEPITAPSDPDEPALFGPLQGVWQMEMVEAERVAEPVFPSSPTDHGSDLCENAAPLDLSLGASGDDVVTNNMTESPSDPVLPCIHGSPANPRGFRTVWYKFVAPASGELVVFTDFNPINYEDSYDTVLALYESPDGTCATLQMLACSDDYHGFFSQVSRFVIEGRTYYIEVADWHFSAQAANRLRLAVILAEGPSFWEGEEGEQIWIPRTRHSVVTDGTYIYIIGGEVVVDPSTRIDSTLRFNPATGQWDALYPMPGIDDNLGYSRTDAAYLNGKIYVPSGYVGNPNAYAGAHLTYIVSDDVWRKNEDPAVPWATASPSGQPYGWIQTVAVPQQNGYYVVGGLLSGDPDPSPPSDAQPTSNLLFYNAGNRSWTTTLPDMATARYAHVAGLVPTPRGPEVCVTGGVGKIDEETAAALRTTECYNINSGTWSQRAPLNFARFAADSAVGPDGRWYVFGGINAQRTPVTLTEVYDPATDTWQVLDSRYAINRPGRALAQGVFVGTTLWVFGGETVPGADVVPLIQRLAQPQLLPVFMRAMVEPGDTMANAWPIALHEEQWHDFAGQEDYFDFFRFSIPARGRYEVEVTSIPPDRNYDVYLYNSNKFPVGFGRAIGNLDELAVTLPLDTGQPYYAAVVRVGGEPTADTYRIVVRPHTP